MDAKYALRLAERWASGGVCSVRSDFEMEEYHRACAEALREKVKRDERKRGCS